MTFSADLMGPRFDSEEDKESSGGPQLVERMLESRSILIAKPVDRSLMEQVARMLILLEAEEADKPVTVYVNSPGGDADSGFAIYDLLRFARPPIRSICAGLAASAAVPIFLGADDGQRYALPHSRFLLHQPSMSMVGQASDLEITSAEILKIRAKYNEIVSKHTGRTTEQITLDCDRDHWLNSTEAVAYGLVDRIVIHRGDLD